jgi:hypothetical protein
MDNRIPPTDELALTALRYAAGDLPPADAAAFEDRLAHDQEAREALGEAIRLSAAALDRPTPAPDPLVREVVREALRPTVFSWLFPRRPYRGHPLTWAGLGGVVAAGLTALGVWLGDQPDDGTPAPTADVTPLANPDAGVPAVLQLTEKPTTTDDDVPGETAPLRPRRGDRLTPADPELPGRSLVTDEEEKPARLPEGKAAVSDPGAR